MLSDLSSVISRRLKFWIGDRSEFLRRFNHATFPEFDIEASRQAIDMEFAALQARRRLLATHSHAIIVTYEGLFGPRVSEPEKIAQINEILGFLGFDPLPTASINSYEWALATNPDNAKWNTAHVYSQLPGIHRLEDALGSDETGWLFR